MGEGRQDTAGPLPSQGHRRISVQEAAEHLGTTVDAIRKRVQRDTIAHDKDPDGRVWILLDTDMPRQDTAGQRQDSGSEMVEELRDRIAYLERQVEEEREARRRADTILAQLSAATAEQARTIRAIEAPASEEVSEAAETFDEATEHRSATAGPQTATQPPQGGTLRELRRRILGW